MLEIVALNDSGRDTRGLDFEYYSHSSVRLEPHILHLLRDLERRGLVRWSKCAEALVPDGDLLPDAETCTPRQKWVRDPRLE